MNLADVVCLLDVFEEFLYISFGKEIGKNLYTDYSCWVRLSPEEKEKARNGEITYDFSRMEMAFNVMIWIVITNKINFFYRDLHCESKDLCEPKDLRLISEDILLKYFKSLFDEGGKLEFQAGHTGVIAMFDRSVIEIIKKKPFQNTHFNHEFHTNEGKQIIENICDGLLKNKDLIYSLYKKDYTKLTEKELRRFCEDHLKIKISENKSSEILGLIKPA